MKLSLEDQQLKQKAGQYAIELLHQFQKLPEIDLRAAKKECVAVFSIDMNLGFTRQGSLSSPLVEQIIPATAAFLQKAKEKGILIQCFSDRHQLDSSELVNYPVHCVTPEEYRLVPELEALELPTLYKNSTNGFWAEGFEQTPVYKRLQAGQREQCFILTGCCTDICVFHFAVSLKTYCNQHNVPSRIIVPLDLVETYEAPGHDQELCNLFSLAFMAANGITLCKKVLL